MKERTKQDNVGTLTGSVVGAGDGGLEGMHRKKETNTKVQLQTKRWMTYWSTENKANDYNFRKTLLEVVLIHSWNILMRPAVRLGKTRCLHNGLVTWPLCGVNPGIRLHILCTARHMWVTDKTSILTVPRFDSRVVIAVIMTVLNRGTKLIGMWTHRSCREWWVQIPFDVWDRDMDPQKLSARIK